MDTSEIKMLASNIESIDIIRLMYNVIEYTLKDLVVYAVRKESDKDNHIVYLNNKSNSCLIGKDDIEDVRVLKTKILIPNAKLLHDIDTELYAKEYSINRKGKIQYSAHFILCNYFDGINMLIFNNDNCIERFKYTIMGLVALPLVIPLSIIFGVISLVLNVLLLHNKGNDINISNNIIKE